MEDKTLLGAKNISLLVSDVDGVLTDGRLYYMPGMPGHMKAFHVRDGLAVKLAQKAGIRIAFVSAKKSEVLQERGLELEVDFCIDGVLDKLTHTQEICDKLHIKMSEVAVIGDDLVDLPLIRRAGIGATVPEAPIEVRNRADYVTELAGGQGAFREFVEFLIRSKGLWNEVIEPFGGVHEVR